ncbi:hypothetical protein ACWFRB_14440 [Rhodococcus sp. NPDC055112]
MPRPVVRDVVSAPVPTPKSMSIGPIEMPPSDEPPLGRLGLGGGG